MRDINTLVTDAIVVSLSIAAMLEFWFNSENLV